MRKTLTVVMVLLCPSLARAQTARDSAFAVKARVALDSVARDKTAPMYSRRNQTRLRAWVDSLVRVPVPVPPPPPVNVAPKAIIAVSCANTTRLCSVNGSASTDDKAVTSYSWAWGDGAVSTGVTASHTFAAAGAYTVALTVRDAEGLAGTAQQSVTLAAADSVVVVTGDTSKTPALAELPRVTPSFTIPAATRVVRVTAPADLQLALNAAIPGDSLILSGTFTGNFTLPTRSCSAQWITITSAAVLPPAGTRVTPAAAAGFAKIITPNSARALQTAQPTCGWRIAGIEIAASASAGVPNVSLNYGIVWLGDGGWVGGGETQVSLAQVPQQILLDRVYIHGAPLTNTTRCLKLDSGNTVIRDSWLSDCHALGSDSQAILGCNGPGPYLIENNYLEGAGENVMFGGCDPAAPELVPSDITFRRNHVRKPLAWKGQWTLKNPIEFKDVRRALVDANVFEGSPPDAQAGMAIVVKSSTETCGACTWEGSKDVTITNNIFRGSGRGLNIQAIDGSSAGTTASHTERVTVANNLFTGIGTVGTSVSQDGWLTLLTHDLRDISITRNTFIGNTPGLGMAVVTAYSGGMARRIDISGNVFAGQGYYAIRDDGGLHAAALTAFAGASWTFARNVVAQVDAQFVGAMPPNNQYFASVSALGIKPDGSTLFPTVGADIPALMAKVAGVVVP